MPRLVDVIERDAVLTEAVLRLAGECGVAAVTLRGVAERAGLTLAEVRYARPTRDRLLHLAVARVAARRVLRRRDALLHAGGPGAEVVDCWLPPLRGEDGDDVESERGWQALRWAMLDLPVGTRAIVRDDDEALRHECVAATGTPDEALLLTATAEGLAAALARGSLDLAAARDLLGRAVSATAPATTPATTPAMAPTTRPAPGPTNVVDLIRAHPDHPARNAATRSW